MTSTRSDVNEKIDDVMDVNDDRYEDDNDVEIEL